MIWLRRAGRFLPLVILAAAAWVLWREFRGVEVADLSAAMRGWGATRIGAALALSALSFVVMGVCEWVGLRWAGARTPFGPTLWFSFVASALGHSLGANVLVSGAVRARLYGRYGVTMGQVAAVTGFQAVGVILGLAALAGAGVLTAKRSAFAAATGLDPRLAEAAGAVLIALVVGYLALCALTRRPIRFGRREFRTPSLPDAGLQVAIGTLDAVIAAAILWVLLPPGAVSLPAFAAVYAPAVVAGLVSNAPGGLGVFEGVVAAGLGGVPRPALAAAFLGYRLIFFVAPLILAIAALAVDSVRRR